MERERIAEQEPSRVSIATYTNYPDAQRAVDYLSDQLFPVERVAIVAEGIRLVEQVTGRVNYAVAALNGALSGAFIGAILGFIFGLWNWISPVISALNLALWGIAVGALAGALMGLLVHALSGGQRDFSSVTGMQAERYNLLVDAEVADEADRLLTAFNSGARGSIERQI